MLLLNRGTAAGTHFYTRGLQLRMLPRYVVEQQRSGSRALGLGGEIVTEGRKGGSEYAGAFVFPSVLGYHEGVAALDFKSLYPSVMTLFNISPETWVPRDRVGEHSREELTMTPSGASFLRGKDGIIPSVFRETLEKRKVYQKLQLAEEGMHPYPFVV